MRGGREKVKERRDLGLPVLRLVEQQAEPLRVHAAHQAQNVAAQRRLGPMRQQQRQGIEVGGRLQGDDGGIGLGGEKGGRTTR